MYSWEYSHQESGQIQRKRKTVNFGLLADVRGRRRLDVSEPGQDRPHWPRTDPGPGRATDGTPARTAAHHLENSPSLGDDADGGKPRHRSRRRSSGVVTPAPTSCLSTIPTYWKLRPNSRRKRSAHS